LIFLIHLAEIVKEAVEHIPPMVLLFAAPVAIIILATVATGIATFIDRQLPASKPH